MAFKRISIFWALMVICLGPWPAGASPLYIAATGGPAYITNTGSTPQTADFTYPPDINGYAYATSGVAGAVVGGYSHLIYDKVGSSSSFGATAGAAYGQFIFDDVIISGPTAKVDTSLNLWITGNLSASSTINGTDTFINVSSVVVLHGGFGPPLAGTNFGGQMTAETNSTPLGTTNTFTAVNIFSGYSGGWPGSGLLNSGPLTNMPVGTPLNLELMLSAKSSVGGGHTVISFEPFDAYGESITDFYHSLGFPTSGDVFNLPDGYTVNSVSGNIVNNRWVGAPAPLPSTMLLLGTGIVSLAGWRRRKRS